MRVKAAMLVALAGMGLSIAYQASAGSRNLSCISDSTVHERQVVRDCGQNAEPQPHAIIDQDPPFPPLPRRFVKNGESKGEGNRSHDRGHDAQGGGNPGGPN